MLKYWSRSFIATFLALALPAWSMAQVSLNVSVNLPPPALPVYDQPPVPGDGYLWTPGYWAWSDDIQDYYWVPGTWILAPQPDYLWTPGYWAVSGAVFLWHPGYWGPHVGFYGGVNYGYGYGGEGYEGGYWRDGHIFYNRSVNNISNARISNVYEKTVINNVTVNRVSYNGGRLGIQARPSAADEAAAHERHVAVTPMQRQHQQTALNNPALRVSENRGRPPIAATPRPGNFSGSGVVAPRGGTMSVVHANPPTSVEPRASMERHAPVEQPAPTEPRAAAERRAPVEQRPPAQPRSLAEPRAPTEPRQAQPPHPSQTQPRLEHEARPAAPNPRSEPHPEHSPSKEEHDHHQA